jgi:hypothetical protein
LLYGFFERSSSPEFRETSRDRFSKLFVRFRRNFSSRCCGLSAGPSPPSPSSAKFRRRSDVAGSLCDVFLRRRSDAFVDFSPFFVDFSPFFVDFSTFFVDFSTFFVDLSTFFVDLSALCKEFVEWLLARESRWPSVRLFPSADADLEAI